MAAGLAKRMLRPWVAAAAPVLRPVSGLLLWQGAMQALKQQGFAPKTVFDIGVADGTPELYAAIPEAQYHLVDPTPEALPHMQAIAGQMKPMVPAVSSAMNRVRPTPSAVRRTWRRETPWTCSLRRALIASLDSACGRPAGSTW